MQPEDLTAHLPHLLDGVAYQNGGGPAGDDLPHLGLALLAEGPVAHRQNLVQNQDARLHQAGDGEGQPALHPAGQLLEGPVLELPELGKLDDLLVGLVHEFPGVSQHGPTQVGVLPDRQIPVESAAQLQQRGDVALPLHPALRGLHDPGDHLQKGALPRPVGPDDPQHVPLLQGEGHVPVRPELHHVVVVGQLPHHVLLDADLLEVPRHVADGHVVHFQNAHAVPPLHIVQKPGVVLLVHPAPDAQHDGHVRQHQQVEPHRGYGGLDDDLAEVADEQVHRVEEEQMLRHRGVAVDGIENCRHIHQKLGEHAPQVLDIPEKDKQRREDQPHADVEQHQQGHGVKQEDDLPGECDTVQEAKEDEHDHGQAEVDEGLDIFGKEEQILGHIDLGEDGGVAHEGGHSLTRGFIEIGENQVPAEQVGGIVLHVPPEKLGKHQAHDQKHQ